MKFKYQNIGINMLFIILTTTIAAYIFGSDNKYTENPTNYYNTGGSLYTGSVVSEHTSDISPNSPHSGVLGIVGHLYEQASPEYQFIPRTNANHWIAN